ncbi:uncharacterized protein LOC128995246 [Macrosteles quadrilineatus]|uniref:uncharacterized protein LOC128995246 n=1 Tax=Macrosteles quadrilineatus TaxID=74068 RepID=UPI0023E201E5|nr:uncharacterized protein LOC128995246 [Macrosteles quadrilineatus]
MFVYVICLLILLFFQITSESDKNANFNDKKGYFHEREINQDNNHYLESSTETISREEDPEFPLYLDSQVLLDNQDAEISPQIRGIKRYVKTEKNLNCIRYHNPTENKNKQQSSVGNKPIGSTAYCKMRRKRNLIGKNKFKNHTKKRPLRSSRENEDEEEGWKTQKQFDLCAYRPNDECFQSEQKRTKTLLSTPEPTVLADDYFQDEMQTLSQNHQVTNNTLKQSYSISASITNMTRASKDTTKPQIAPTNPKNKNNITVNFSVTQVSFGNTTASTPTKKGTTEDMCKQVLYTFVREHQTTNTPETKLSAFFKKLTNNSIIQNKSSTKSSIITLHHKEPCKEVEVTVKPIVERVLSIIPKPTDKIPSEHYNQSVNLRHKKVYPINHKGNHYYHGKHPLRVSKTTGKCITTPGEPSIGQSMPKHLGNNEKLVPETILTSEKYKSNTNSEHTIVTTSPGKFTLTMKENKSFITKRRVGQAHGNKESSVEMLNGSTFFPIDNKCAVFNVTNDIKEILPQKFHKEYLSRTPIEPMKVFHGVSKIKKKPKNREKFYLCSSNKTIFNN